MTTTIPFCYAEQFIECPICIISFNLYSKLMYIYFKPLDYLFGCLSLYYIMWIFHCSIWAPESMDSRAYGLGSCGTWAWLPRVRWDLGSPTRDQTYPALQGGFLTIGPPGKLQ